MNDNDRSALIRSMPDPDLARAISSCEEILVAPSSPQLAEWTLRELGALRGEVERRASLLRVVEVVDGIEREHRAETPDEAVLLWSEFTEAWRGDDRLDGLKIVGPGGRRFVPTIEDGWSRPVFVLPLVEIEA